MSSAAYTICVGHLKGRFLNAPRIQRSRDTVVANNICKDRFDLISRCRIMRIPKEIWIPMSRSVRVFHIFMSIFCCGECSAESFACLAVSAATESGTGRRFQERLLVRGEGLCFQTNLLLYPRMFRQLFSGSIEDLLVVALMLWLPQDGEEEFQYLSQAANTQERPPLTSNYRAILTMHVIAKRVFPKCYRHD